MLRTAISVILSIISTFRVLGMLSWHFCTLTIQWGFNVIHVKPTPKTLVMDATSLSFRQELGFWNGPPVVMNVPKHRISKGKSVERYMFGCFLSFVFRELWFLTEGQGNS